MHSFIANQNMKIGTYYYPEQWPREQWERDFDTMQRMGLQIVHMGEFAWFDMEPEEGKINLDWLAECVEMAARRDMKVILCTPTAAPPIWLVEKYPEILPVDQYGRRKRFGGRRHYNPLAPAMIQAAKRIVTALADRFGQHPAIIGWQIDNEFCGEFDQSELTHQVFQSWLEEKYGTIEKLNAAWGNQFWTSYYTDFSQIHMPPERFSLGTNPHQRLDASRFWSWCFAQFAKVQAQILKPRVGNRFITTNFMPLCPDANPDDFAEDLTLYAWDAYPVGDVKPTTDQTFRMGDPALMSLVHDQMASYTGRWCLMELQPGQINWNQMPVLVYPGAIRLWIWTALAHGAEFVTTYRFRQPRFNTEMFHHGLITLDGVTPSTGGREFQQTVSEVRRLDPAKLAGAAQPSGKSHKKSVATPQAPDRPAIALYLDFQQLWYYQTLPQSRRWDYRSMLVNLYGAMLRLGVDARVIRPGQKIPSNVRLLVVPGVQMVSEAMINSWREYLAAGGNLLITCRTALMDMNGQFFEGPLAAPIADLIGGSIDAYDCLPEGLAGQVEMDDVQYPWGVWGDLLYAEEETKILASYANQFYAGAAAVIQKKHGNSTVTYCGVFPEEEFADALMEKLARQIQLPIHPTPRRVYIARCGSYRICLNYQSQPYTLEVPEDTHFVVGSRIVEAADVAVWEEQS